MNLTPIFGTATVTTAGTAVQIAAAMNTADGGQRNQFCRKVIFVADAGNTGKIKLGIKGNVPITLAAGQQLPVEYPEYHILIDLLDYWADASANGQIVNFIAFQK